MPNEILLTEHEQFLCSLISKLPYSEVADVIKEGCNAQYDKSSAYYEKKIAEAYLNGYNEGNIEARADERAKTLREVREWLEKEGMVGEFGLCLNIEKWDKILKALKSGTMTQEAREQIAKLIKEHENCFGWQKQGVLTPTSRTVADQILALVDNYYKNLYNKRYEEEMPRMRPNKI